MQGSRSSLALRDRVTTWLVVSGQTSLHKSLLRLAFLFSMLSFVQVPQWDNDWTKCSVFVPDTACHWYVVNPDNTFGKGFSWITAPEFDVAALRDIGIQHEVTVAQGYQTTVELMNSTSNIKYGDNY